MTTEPWQEGILRDLRPFCDPGSIVDRVETPRGSLIRWEARGESKEATFFQRDGALRVLFKDQEMSYVSFLSSPEIGDLLYLSRMMLQAAPATLFVSTLAELMAEGAEARPQGATDLVHELLRSPEGGATTLVFITGDAGSGKTHVLRELVKQQAGRYRKGETSQLYLYINAQGRALAKVDEAFAVELDDLRARLTYSAIAPLVRNGLIVPIIDGFDELVGTTGYDDAFESLKRFLDDLQGQGELVASARSVYYEQEFLRRATQASTLGPQQWTVVPVEMLPWGEDEFRRFLDGRYEFGGARINRAEFVTKMREVFRAPANRDLLGKPLFVSKTAELILSGGPVLTGRSLLEELVAWYVERERSEKLLIERQPILSSRQIESLLAFIAEEMWLQETRELDARSVREVAEVVVDQEKLSPRVRQVVMQRVPSLAMLVPVRGGERIMFEHDVFFAYYLSQHILEALSGVVARLHASLSRGQLPAVTCDLVAWGLAATPLGEVIKKLVAASEMDSIRAQQARGNAGAIAAAVLRKDATAEPAADLFLRRAVFAGVSLAAVKLRRWSFRECEFRQVDLRGAELTDCDAYGVKMFEVIVDPRSTKLDIRGMDITRDVRGLRLPQNGGLEVLYNPEKVRAALRRCRMPGTEEAYEGLVREVEPNYLELLEIVMQAFRYGNTITPTDEKHRRWSSRTDWRSLQRMLVDAGVLEIIEREQKGTRRIGLRLKWTAEEVLGGLEIGASLPEPVAAFWGTLEREYQRRRAP